MRLTRSARNTSIDPPLKIMQPKGKDVPHTTDPVSDEQVRKVQSKNCRANDNTAVPLPKPKLAFSTILLHSSNGCLKDLSAFVISGAVDTNLKHKQRTPASDESGVSGGCKAKGVRTKGFLWLPRQNRLGSVPESSADGVPSFPRGLSVCGLRSKIYCDYGIRDGSGWFMPLPRDTENPHWIPGIVYNSKSAKWEVRAPLMDTQMLGVDDGGAVTLECSRKIDCILRGRRIKTLIVRQAPNQPSIVQGNTCRGFPPIFQVLYSRGVLLKSATELPLESFLETHSMRFRANSSGNMHPSSFHKGRCLCPKSSM